jgi:hypothetical protein
MRNEVRGLRARKFEGAVSGCLLTYYTVNLQFEKRFNFFGRYWALRGGFDNITNHGNAAPANSVIDRTRPSPTFIDTNGSAFTGRIRHLGQQ